jgi:PAS domain S-box-containing protein
MKAFNTEKSKKEIPATILVVEDDKGLNRLIQKKLQREGFKTEGVFNGSDTIAKVVENPNLLLLDYILPDMTSKELIKTLFKQECSVPFMVMTGHGDEKIAVEMMKLGARDYIIKDPDFIDVLPQMLKKVFENLDKEKRLITAEEELRKAKDFAESIVSSAMDGIIVVDLKGDFIQINSAFLKMIGYSDEELKNIGFRQITPKKWRVEDAAHFKKLLLEGMTSTHYEKELIKKDGAVFPVTFSTSLLYDEKDNPFAIMAIIRDETERKQAEEQTKQLEQYLRLQIDRMPTGLIVWDTEFRVRSWNPAAEKIFGFTVEETLGKHPYNLIVPREIQPHVDNIWRRLLEGDMTAYSINENITKDGRTIICDWSNTPLTETDGTVTGVLSMVQDITKRKQAEEKLKKLYAELKESQSQLIQSEKMSAVGTLVAGVAHELNNPITAILHFTQYCIKHTSEEDRLYTILQDIEKETRSCIDTTQNLLTFSHMQAKEAYQKESLNTILSRVLKLLSYRIEKDNISISKHIAIGIPDIPMNVNNMQQVFLNLLNNALDAVKESKEKKIDIDIQHEGEYVKVIIADSGCGIAPENIDNLFVPFFTTKSIGQGTGLGLSLCHSIIKAHNGEITCESVPGQGTKFKILLPAATAKDAKGAESAKSATAKGAKGTKNQPQRTQKAVTAKVAKNG